MQGASLWGWSPEKPQAFCPLSEPSVQCLFLLLTPGSGKATCCSFPQIKAEVGVCEPTSQRIPPGVGRPGQGARGLRPFCQASNVERAGTETPIQVLALWGLGEVNPHATFPTWKTRAGVYAILWGFNVRRLMQQAHSHLPLGHEHLCPKALQCDCTPMGLL